MFLCLCNNVGFLEHHGTRLTPEPDPLRSAVTFATPAASSGSADADARAALAAPAAVSAASGAHEDGTGDGPGARQAPNRKRRRAAAGDSPSPHGEHSASRHFPVLSAGTGAAPSLAAPAASSDGPSAEPERRLMHSISPNLPVLLAGSASSRKSSLCERMRMFLVESPEAPPRIQERRVHLTEATVKGIRIPLGAVGRSAGEGATELRYGESNGERAKQR